MNMQRGKLYVSPDTDIYALDPNDHMMQGLAGVSADSDPAPIRNPNVD